MCEVITSMAGRYHNYLGILYLVFLSNLLDSLEPPSEAINRCAVLQKARSIRVVLVLKDAKLDVGVARGGSAIRDLEVEGRLQRGKVRLFAV